MPIENMNSVIKLVNVNAVYKQNNNKIIVQVTKKMSLEDLENQDIIPRYINGIKTDVIEKGKIKHHNNNKYRPIIGGISCCDSNIGSATLGAIVRDSVTGALVGLTCNHCAGVLYDINYDTPYYGNTALSHIKMYQPSPNDGGILADSLGAPIRAIPLQLGSLGTNIVDAAIIEIPYNLSKTDIINLHLGPFPFITSKLDYTVGTSIWKMGRTTDLTQGTITNTNVNLIADLDGVDVYYYGQIMADLEGDSGDSGSVVLTKETGIWKILGLYFAGNETQGFFSHILDVVDLLQIEAWNGNIVVDGEYPYLMSNGHCYKYKGYTLNPNSHIKQRDYDDCAECKSEAYPNSKVQVIN